MNLIRRRSMSSLVNGMMVNKGSYLQMFLFHIGERRLCIYIYMYECICMCIHVYNVSLEIKLHILCKCFFTYFTIFVQYLYMMIYTYTHTTYTLLRDLRVRLLYPRIYSERSFYLERKFLSRFVIRFSISVLLGV